MEKKRIKIGVMGSASGPTIRDPRAQELARRLGEAVADRGCICITGACPGLPDHAAAGAKARGGFVFGVSPAFSEAEHLQVYGSPMQHYDMILFSGMGLMERDIVNIRSSDAVVIVGGGIGTLNEFTVAYEEMKPVGVLTGTGGIADHIGDILAKAGRHAPPERVMYEPDPARLVERLLDVLTSHKPPMRESDIGGEKEAPRNEKVASVLQEQREAHDRAKRKRADKEYD
ncbi:MAG TPA: LOG family protein [Myxococcota bacterium]|nr:LOG family protein [Myxococcota bacterium]HRY95906.1 LOG family protein [Myxococcota bacterium]